MLKVFAFVDLIVVTGQECLAIAMEGGGGRGAYEAGVIIGLVNATNAPNIRYIILCKKIDKYPSLISNCYLINKEFNLTINVKLNGLINSDEMQ